MKSERGHARTSTAWATPWLAPSSEQQAQHSTAPTLCRRMRAQTAVPMRLLPDECTWKRPLTISQVYEAASSNKARRHSGRLLIMALWRLCRHWTLSILYRITTRPQARTYHGVTELDGKKPYTGCASGEAKQSALIWKLVEQDCPARCLAKAETLSQLKFIFVHEARTVATVQLSGEQMFVKSSSTRTLAMADLKSSYVMATAALKVLCRLVASAKPPCEADVLPFLLVCLTAVSCCSISE